MIFQHPLQIPYQLSVHLYMGPSAAIDDVLSIKRLDSSYRDKWCFMLQVPTPRIGFVSRLKQKLCSTKWRSKVSPYRDLINSETFILWNTRKLLRLFFLATATCGLTDRRRWTFSYPHSSFNYKKNGTLGTTTMPHWRYTLFGCSQYFLFEMKDE